VRQAEAQAARVSTVSDADLAAAKAAVATAQAGLDRVLAGRSFEVEAAQRAVDQARAQLALRQAGASEAEMAAARARAAQAETALAQAQAQLGELQLVAPFGGTVTQVAYRAGEQAAPGTGGITLGDLDQLRVETKDLDEIGAARVEEGQRARLRVDAIERTLEGRVTALNPQGVTTPAGDSVFTATIALDQPDAKLRWGQTVRVEFAEVP
jgi:multidrug resistance efflux pump